MMSTTFWEKASRRPSSTFASPSLGANRSMFAAGKGITQSALAKIWEPFFTTKVSVGTGLGLWVTREILTKHKPELRLRSSTQGSYRGTTFSIVFPASS